MLLSWFSLGVGWVPLHAIDLPLSFRLEAAPGAVAVQFDVVSSVPSATFSTPVLTNIGPHAVDFQRQLDGRARYVIYSADNAPLNATGRLDVTLSLTSTPTSGFLSITQAKATTAAGQSLDASPNLLPIFLSSTPSTETNRFVQGTTAPWAVEAIDPDGHIASVTLLWNGNAQQTDTAAPFGGALPTNTVGDFTAAFVLTDARGATVTVPSPGVPVSIFTPTGGTSWTDFLNTHFAPGLDRRPDTDTFGLGFPNLLAYALGLDPRTPNRALYPTFTVETEAGQRYAVYRVDLNEAAQVTAGYQVSSTFAPGSWQPASAATTRQTSLGNGRRRYELRLPLTGTTPTQFGRLHLTQP